MSKIFKKVGKVVGKVASLPGKAISSVVPGKFGKILGGVGGAVLLGGLGGLGPLAGTLSGVGGLGGAAVGALGGSLVGRGIGGKAGAAIGLGLGGAFGGFAGAGGLAGGAGAAGGGGGLGGSFVASPALDAAITAGTLTPGAVPGVIAGAGATSNILSIPSLTAAAGFGGGGLTTGITLGQLGQGATILIAAGDVIAKVDQGGILRNLATGAALVNLASGALGIAGAFGAFGGDAPTLGDFGIQQRGNITTPSFNVGIEPGATTLTRIGGLDPATVEADLSRRLQGINVGGLGQGIEQTRQGIAGTRQNLRDFRGLTGGLRGQVAVERGQFGERLGALRERVGPGVSAVTQARLTEIENARSRAAGNLRQELSTRRVLGSSFGQDSLVRQEAAFAEAAAEAAAQGEVESISISRQLTLDEATGNQNFFQITTGLLALDADSLRREVDLIAQESRLTDQETNALTLELTAIQEGRLQALQTFNREFAELNIAAEVRANFERTLLEAAALSVGIEIRNAQAKGTALAGIPVAVQSIFSGLSGLAGGS